MIWEMLTAPVDTPIGVLIAYMALWLWLVFRNRNQGEPR